MSIIAVGIGAFLVSAIGYVVGAWAMWRAQRPGLLVAADLRQNTAAMQLLRSAVVELRGGLADLAVTCGDRHLRLLKCVNGDSSLSEPEGLICRVSECERQLHAWYDGVSECERQLHEWYDSITTAVPERAEDRIWARLRELRDLACPPPSS